MRTDFEGGPHATEGDRGSKRNIDWAALPWSGKGLPVSALILAEEDVVIAVNGDALIATRGHRKDGEMAGQRTWGGECRLKPIDCPP